MATNFLQRDKSKIDPGPANYLTGGGDDVVEQQRKKLIPIVPQDDDGFVPVNMGGQQPVDETAPKPNSVPVFNNDPSPTDALSAMIGTPLASLPSFQRAMEARQRALTLKAMPTYVDKKGQTVEGLEDKDGRLQSGLKGIVQGLAENFGNGRQIRDYGDLLAGVTGTIVRGAGGSIVSSWNEWADRDREIAKAEAEEAEATKQVEWDSKRLTEETGRQTKLEASDRADEALRNRKRSDFRKANPAFDPARVTEAQVRQLAEFGETPDSVGAYDFTKADTKMFGGKVYRRDPIDGALVDTGLRDEEKEIVEYEVTDPNTGIKHTFRTSQKDAARLYTGLQSKNMTIVAAREKQKSDQEFKAGQKDKDRAFQGDQKDKDRAAALQRAETNAAKKVNSPGDYVTKRLAIQKYLTDGKISAEESTRLLNILSSANPEFKDQ